jgi:beta-glucosidase
VQKPSRQWDFQEPSRPIEERVDDLLGRMSLEEKIAQMDLVVLAHLADFLGVPREGLDSSLVDEGWGESLIRLLKGIFCYSVITDGGVFNEGVASGALGDIPPGFVWGITPSTTAGQAVDAINRLQEMAIDRSRWGIPLLVAEEGLHGLMARGATVFPQAIGLGSTWNPDLIEGVARAIGAEGQASGAGMIFAPVLDISRDPRWGRTEETCGEDPCLTSELGRRFIQGLQGGGGESLQGVAAVAKHFAGHGHTLGGRDSTVDDISERELREIHFPPFKAAIQAGASAVMTAYNTINGVPCTGNKWLLREILQSEWEFDGLVISDAGAMEDLHRKHNVAPDQRAAIKIAILAGMDCHNNGPDFRKPLQELVQGGELVGERIDDAVRRILRLKFRLGLFEQPTLNPEIALRVVHSAEHQTLAYEAARQSVVLLKNDGHFLPLRKDLKAILVTGPNADNGENQVGDYSGRGEILTVLEGLKRKVSSQTEVVYRRGCGVREGTDIEIAQAVDAARDVDLVVMVLGGSSHFGTEGTCGEGRDRASLDLPGKQMDLAKALHATGTPCMVVLINGRPLAIEWISENIPAILEAWYPGEQGGLAIADILFGDVNPSAKLPITFPRSVGQLPCSYNQRLSGRGGGYVDQSEGPLFPFGHGLSYTTFEYLELGVIPDKVIDEGIVRVSVKLRNSGELRGEEIVQVYVKDFTSTVTLPTKLLKAFHRVGLAPGETKMITFDLAPDVFSLWNDQMEQIVEAGRFEILVGSSSEDIRLRGEVEVMTAQRLWA